MKEIKWLRPLNYRRPRYTPVMRGYRYSMDNKPTDVVYKAFFVTPFDATTSSTPCGMQC